MATRKKVDLTPVLSDDKTKCTIADLSLIANTTIDYRASDSTKTSIGKIVSFKYPGYSESDKTSVWMLIADMANDQQREWVSVAVWYEQFCITDKPTENVANHKPANPSNLPF